MERKHSAQEINLLEMLAKLYGTLRRNWLLAIILPVLGIIAGYGQYSLSKDALKSSMMISTRLITEEESNFLFDELGKGRAIFGLTKGKITQIKFSVKEGKKNDSELDKLNTAPPVYFKITATIKDTSALPEIQEAIINYLNNTAPIKRHREQRQKLYNLMIFKIDQELAALNEVEKEVGNQTKATFLDPSTLFSRSVDLYRERVTYELALKDIESVQVVKGFGSPSRPSRIIFVSLGLLAGIILLAIVIFARYFRSYYNQFEKNSSN